jgi:accessory colonization factor AcfC
MKKFDTTGLSRTFNKFGLTLKKHSPEIMVAAGIVGAVTSTVLACKATLKVNNVLDDAKENIEKIHTATEEGVTAAGEEYSVEDSKKDLTIVYVQTGVKLVKLYAPAVITGGLAIASIVKGHNILKTRYVATAAAYAAVEKSFKEYRGRVVERFGKELDRELKYNIKAVEVEETVVDEKTGKEKTVKSTVDVIDPNTIDDTSRVFYEGNPGWSKDPEFNLMYLKKQQAYATEKLRRNGVLFLNEVYDMLGYSKTKAGAVIGWIYDEKNPIGDNFVDFGLYNDVNNKTKAAFINGDERCVLLEFNHDGNILEKM